MTFGLSVSLKNFYKLDSVSEKFLFYTDKIVSVRCQVSDSESMIVSRFITSFTQNFVISCCQITKISASGATVPMRFLQKTLVISVLKLLSQIRLFGK